MKGKLATILPLRKGKVYLHIGPLKNLVRWTLIHVTGYLIN